MSPARFWLVRSCLVVRSDAVRYATPRLPFACRATASPRWMVPLTIAGGNPVREVPRDMPTLSLTTLDPVFVMPEPASIAKFADVPKFIIFFWCLCICICVHIFLVRWPI